MTADMINNAGKLFGKNDWITQPLKALMNGDFEKDDRVTYNGATWTVIRTNGETVQASSRLHCWDRIVHRIKRLFSTNYNHRFNAAVKLLSRSFAKYEGELHRFDDAKRQITDQKESAEREQKTLEQKLVEQTTLLEKTKSDLEARKTEVANNSVPPLSSGLSSEIIQTITDVIGLEEVCGKHGKKEKENQELLVKKTQEKKKINEEIQSLTTTKTKMKKKIATMLGVNSKNLIELNQSSQTLQLEIQNLENEITEYSEAIKKETDKLAKQRTQLGTLKDLSVVKLEELLENDTKQKAEFSEELAVLIEGDSEGCRLTAEIVSLEKEIKTTQWHIETNAAKINALAAQIDDLEAKHQLELLSIDLGKKLLKLYSPSLTPAERTYLRTHTSNVLSKMYGDGSSADSVAKELAAFPTVITKLEALQTDFNQKLTPSRNPSINEQFLAELLDPAHTFDQAKPWIKTLPTGVQTIDEPALPT